MSIGLPAQAPQDERVTADSSTAIQVEQQSVTAPATAAVSFDRPAVSSTPAPAATTVAPKAEQVTPAAAPAATAAPAAAVPAAAAPAAAVGSGHAGVAAAAYAGIGHAYVYGGTSPATGWDCSGFVQWAYAQAGISIPRTNQWVGMVQTANPHPGDLVVQNGGVHVGIYVGNGMVISALNPSAGTLLLPASATGTSVFYTLP